jgi:hypothetical protein
MEKANSNSDELYKLTAPMVGATASVAGKVGIVPAPAIGQQGRLLSGAGTWVEPPVTSPIAGTGMEVGSIEVTITAANAKSLILGGLEFRWSQAGAAGGNLLINNVAGMLSPSSVGTGITRVYTAGNRTESSYSNIIIWGADASNYSIGNHTITSNPAGQHIEYDLMTRGLGDNGVWNVKVFWTQSSTLIIVGTYIGPKII